MEGGRFTAITQITPSWYDKIYASYKDDVMLQDIMRSKLVDVAQSPSFTYVERVVKYKGRVVIGSAGLLREELIKSTHDSYIGGHAGIQNTYRRLKAHFYWPSMKKLVQEIVSIVTFVNKLRLKGSFILDCYRLFQFHVVFGRL